MTEIIAELKNLGEKSQEWLAEIGVFTLEDLKRVGSVECYRLLRQQGLPASLNLVYAIEGALLDVHWTKLPASVKAELKQLVKSI